MRGEVRGARGEVRGWPRRLVRWFAYAAPWWVYDGLAVTVMFGTATAVWLGGLFGLAALVLGPLWGVMLVWPRWRWDKERLDYWIWLYRGDTTKGPGQ